MGGDTQRVIYECKIVFSPKDTRINKINQSRQNIPLHFSSWMSIFHMCQMRFFKLEYFEKMHIGHVQQSIDLIRIVIFYKTILFFKIHITIPSFQM